MKHEVTAPCARSQHVATPNQPIVSRNLDETNKCRATSSRHICIVTETYPPEVNGVAFTLARLADGLRNQGCEVSLVRPRQRDHDSAGFEVNSKGTLVRSLPLPGYKGLQIGLPASRALFRRWQTQRPDFVYVATEGFLGLSAVRLAKRMGIPVFSGFHTNFHTYMRHYRASWLQPVVLRYLRWFHNQTAGTIVACADLCDQLKAIGLNNVRILGRGVDSRCFSPEHQSQALRQRWGAARDQLVVLYVGRIAPEKNLNVVIEAYRAMQRHRQVSRFVLVGDGPQRAALQTQHPDLIFTGVQTGDELARHYASADIFLFASETETFGNVTLEAMASGLAVVAYDYAAAHRHIRQGVNGFLVPLRKRDEFIQAAVTLAGSGEYLPRLRQAARAQASTLDWQHVVRRFSMLLENRDVAATSDTEVMLPNVGDPSHYQVLSVN